MKVYCVFAVVRLENGGTEHRLMAIFASQLLADTFVGNWENARIELVVQAWDVIDTVE